MPDLQPITALGGARARGMRRGAFILEENPDLALASLALRKGASRPVPFGLTLPGPGAWVREGAVSAFWTGPDQWILEAGGRAETDFAAELADQCIDCSVTEQTDGLVAFEIRSTKGGAAIVTLLTKLVNVDPASLQAGSATRTGLEHMSVFVIRRSADQLAILGMRSFAGTLWHALETTISRIAEIPE